MAAVVLFFRRLLYLLAGATALTIYTWQRLDLPLTGWINNYVNDFLCLPLVLGLLTQLFRWIKNDADFEFPLVFVLALATYYSFFFEGYLPTISQRYTQDWVDVGLYFLGAGAYVVVSRRKLRGVH